MTEEEKKTRTKELEDFKLPQDISDKVVHVHPNVLVFQYQGRRHDLTKLSSQRMLKIAAAKDCPILRLKENTQKTTASTPKAESSTTEETSGAKSDTATGTGKKK